MRIKLMVVQEICPFRPPAFPRTSDRRPARFAFVEAWHELCAWNSGTTSQGCEVKTRKIPRRFKKILVPTDFSRHSDLALQYASMLALQFKSELILMHVVESLAYSVTDTLNIVEHRRALETIAGTLLDNLCKEVRANGLEVRTFLASGYAYKEILKRAKQEQVDLIVMGTHGRTGVEHLLLGSVAEKLVRLSACPVLTVRPQMTRGTARKRTHR